MRELFYYKLVTKYKTNISFCYLFLLSLFVSIIKATGIENINIYEENQYNFKLLFEKEFNKNDDYFYNYNFVLGLKDYDNNHFKIMLLPSPVKWGIYIPELVYVDSLLYIVDRNQGLRVFNMQGDLKLSYNFEIGFEFNSFIVKQNGGLAFELTNEEETKNYVISEDISYVVRTNEPIEAKQTYSFGIVVKESNEIMEKICFQGLLNGDDKFISPSRILLLDKNDFTNPAFLNIEMIPEEYVGNFINAKSIIEPHKIDNAKFIYIKNYNFDDLGNLFLSGIKSNKIDVTSDIELIVKDPIYFLWKFEKQP